MIVILYMYSSNLEAPTMRESFRSVKACVNKLDVLEDIAHRTHSEGKGKVTRIDKNTLTVESYYNNKTILTTGKCEAVDFTNQ